jgi:hypothetical protein
MNRKTYPALNFWRSRDARLPAHVIRTITRTGEDLQTFPLPTQVVLTGGYRTSELLQGRAWMWASDLGMKKSEDGRSSWRVYNALVEIWTNVGDDGHTEYALVGYAEMTEEIARAYIKAWRTLEHWREQPQLQNVDEWN